MDSIKQRILEIIGEQGPVGDEAISGQIVDQWSADDVEPHTRELAEQGYIKESEFAPNRWQITDKGREYLRSGGGEAS